MSKTVKVFSPATIGNIGPGFDVLGLALKGMGDIVEVWKIPGDKIVIEEIENADHPISKDPDQNTAGIAAREVLKLLKLKEGIGMHITKGMPAGSGLGSSAASAAAAAYAVNLLFDEPLSKMDLILPATLAEEYVSGAFFADNVAPALLGGATLTRSSVPLDVTHLGTISDLTIILALPNIQILTKDARDILPKEVEMKNFVGNMANACLIASAFSTDNYKLFSRSLKDIVIEPVRSKLIPGFNEVKAVAIEAGADGMTISGAGPAVFAITNSKKKAPIIEDAMTRTFQKNGVDCKTLITTPSPKGSVQITTDDFDFFKH